MKSLIQQLESLSSVLDSLTSISDLEDSDSDYLLHLISDIKTSQARLLSLQKESHISAEFASEKPNQTFSLLEPGNSSLHTTEANRDEYLQKILEALACAYFDEAKLIIEEALSLFPDDGEFLTHYGLACWESGSMNEAAAAYKAAMANTCPDHFTTKEWLSYPDHPFLKSMEGYALALYQLRDFEQAIEFFETLFDLNPKRYAGCIYLAGEATHLLNNPEKALEYYRVSPFEPCVLYNRGLAYFQLEKKIEAACTFIQAFALNPHIAAHLAGKNTTLHGVASGFLKTSDYATEFLSLCASLWSDEAAINFVRELFGHPLVQSHLAHFDEDGYFHCAEGVFLNDEENQDEPINRHIKRIVKHIFSPNA